MSQIVKILTFITIIIYTSGCNGVNLSSGSSKKGDDINWEVNNITAELVKRLTSNRTFYEDEGPAVAITSFYYTEDANQSKKLPIILADSIIHQMQKQGYRPIDYKLMPTVKVVDGGYKYTKNMEELREKGFVNLVLIGTLTELFEGMLVNARIIDIRTGVVVSSAQTILDMQTLENIFKEPEAKYRDLYMEKTEEKREIAPESPVKVDK